MMSKQAHGSYKSTGRPSSDQTAVWREVDRKLHAMKSGSPSAELEAVYESHQSRLDEVIAQARLPADAAGVVFAFGGHVAGLDLFDQPATLAKAMPKLVRAYAVDALEETDAKTTLSRADVESWLRSATEATFERFNSPGIGDDVRIQGRLAVGAGLVVEDQPVHVELFPEHDGGSERAEERHEVRPAQAPVPEPRAVVQPAPVADQPVSPATAQKVQDAARSGWWTRLRQALGR
jgi:hypothetical protein